MGGFAHHWQRVDDFLAARKDSSMIMAEWHGAYDVYVEESRHLLATDESQGNKRMDKNALAKLSLARTAKNVDTAKARSTSRLRIVSSAMIFMRRSTLGASLARV